MTSSKQYLGEGSGSIQQKGTVVGIQVPRLRPNFNIQITWIQTGGQPYSDTCPNKVS